MLLHLIKANVIAALRLVIQYFHLVILTPLRLVQMAMKKEILILDMKMD